MTSGAIAVDNDVGVVLVLVLVDVVVLLEVVVFETRDAAEIHLSKIRVDRHQGTHVLTTRTTVGEYGDEWVRTQIHQRASSAEQMEIRWRVHIRPTLGHILLADLTR